MDDKQSRVISFRLHPSDEHEAAAIEILDRLNKEGYSYRKTIVDALLIADGRTPEMFRGQPPSALTPGVVQSLLEDFARHIVGELRNSGADFANEDRGFDADDRTSVFEKNLAKTFMERRKARGE